MEWMDALALDPALSPAAYKVAGVIGSHFNRHAGYTFLKQETVAGIMGLSARTVWTAIMELERRGYLIVERRELGVRASDGRRAAGGKGVANTYLPAFQGSQVTATKTGRKLAAHCEHWWEQSSQNHVAKVATNCDPTLKTNPLRTPARVDHTLGDAGEQLCQQIGDTAFRSWFAQVRCEGVSGDTVMLSTPSAFERKWILEHYQEVIVACWKRVHSRGIERVEMTVRHAR